ncbi:MAG TPA: IPT/TIG domain-containing protein [Pyrinomonadaceae bacterium]
MADSLVEVKPGDLITSEMWNDMVARLTQLTKTLDEVSRSSLQGTMTVPDVFGRKLSDAKAILAMPENQLGMGFIVDASGKIIDPTLQSSAKLIVIGQAPGPGTKVNPGSSVGLAVSAPIAPTGTTTLATPGPKIKGFQPDPAPVGSEVTIGGEAFAADPKDNIVFFDGVKADTPTKSTGNTLLVIVPKGIKDAPVKPGDKTRVDVPVTVKVGDKTAEGFLDISAPISEKAAPKIDTITPTVGIVSTAQKNSTITINGTGFATDPKANFVRFSAFPKDGVNPDTAKENQLVVVVPKELAQFMPEAGVPQSFDVTVTTDAGTSNTKSHNFMRS